MLYFTDPLEYLNVYNFVFEINKMIKKLQKKVLKYIQYLVVKYAEICTF